MPFRTDSCSILSYGCQSNVYIENLFKLIFRFQTYSVTDRWAVAVHAAWKRGSFVQNENSVMDSDYSLKAYRAEQMSSDGPSTKITNLSTAQTPVNVIRLLCVYTCSCYTVCEYNQLSLYSRVHSASRLKNNA